jgi:hypothetical protein
MSKFAPLLEIGGHASPAPIISTDYVRRAKSLQLTPSLTLEPSQSLSFANILKILQFFSV